jgi:hypothetical protein
MASLFFLSFNNIEDNNSSIRYIDIIKNDDCKLYKERVRKLLTFILKMPISNSEHPSFIWRREYDKHAEYDQIYFIPKPKVDLNDRYQVRVHKYVFNGELSVGLHPIGNEFYTNPFVANIVIPNIDFSNIKKVKDIYKQPGGNHYTMVLGDARGREVSYEVKFGGNYHVEGTQNYNSWLLDCLD